jgi:uncharacterized membrane protein (GlpM family)
MLQLGSLQDILMSSQLYSERRDTSAVALRSISPLAVRLLAVVLYVDDTASCYAGVIAAITVWPDTIWTGRIRNSADAHV